MMLFRNNTFRIKGYRAMTKKGEQHEHICGR